MTIRERKTAAIIADGWASYERNVVPPDAGPDQRTETRRAFYAGAWAVLCEMRELGEPHVTEDEGVAGLSAMIDECESFVAALNARDA